MRACRTYHRIMLHATAEYFMGRMLFATNKRDVRIGAPTQSDIRRPSVSECAHHSAANGANTTLTVRANECKLLFAFVIWRCVAVARGAGEPSRAAIVHDATMHRRQQPSPPRWRLLTLRVWHEFENQNSSQDMFERKCLRASPQSPPHLTRCQVGIDRRGAAADGLASGD